MSLVVQREADMRGAQWARTPMGSAIREAEEGAAAADMAERGAAGGL